MLTQAERAMKQQRVDRVPRLEPHPYERNEDRPTSTGGDDIFGGFGAATVYTNVRAGYATECPNVGKLLRTSSSTCPWKTR